MANETKEVKKQPVKKTEEKSVLYHKDGVIFIDIYKEPEDLSQFTKLSPPKGVTITCTNCGTEMAFYSEHYKAYYCSHCLRLYPDHQYDLEKPKSKKELQKWTELIRPIVPSSKNKPKKEEKVESPPGLTPEEIAKAEGFKELQGLF